MRQWGLARAERGYARAMMKWLVLLVTQGLLVSSFYIRGKRQAGNDTIESQRGENTLTPCISQDLLPMISITSFNQVRLKLHNYLESGKIFALY